MGIHDDDFPFKGCQIILKSLMQAAHVFWANYHQKHNLTISTLKKGIFVWPLFSYQACKMAGSYSD